MFLEGMPMVIFGGRSRACIQDDVDETAVVKVWYIILSACRIFVLRVIVTVGVIISNSPFPPPSCCGLASRGFCVLLACRNIDRNFGYLPAISFSHSTRVTRQFTVQTVEVHISQVIDVEIIMQENFFKEFFVAFFGLLASLPMKSVKEEGGDIGIWANDALDGLRLGG